MYARPWPVLASAPLIECGLAGSRRLDGQPEWERADAPPQEINGDADFVEDYGIDEEGQEWRRTGAAAVGSPRVSRQQRELRRLSLKTRGTSDAGAGGGGADGADGNRDDAVGEVSRLRRRTGGISYKEPSMLELERNAHAERHFPVCVGDKLEAEVTLLGLI